MHVGRISLQAERLQIELPGILVVALGNSLTGLEAQTLDAFTHHEKRPQHGVAESTWEPSTHKPRLYSRLHPCHNWKSQMPMQVCTYDSSLLSCRLKPFPAQQTARGRLAPVIAELRHRREWIRPARQSANCGPHDRQCFPGGKAAYSCGLLQCRRSAGDDS